MVGETTEPLNELFLSCAPIVTLWVLSATWAWIRTPQRRGAIAQRRRDRHAPRVTNRSTADLVDLSQRAAGYWVGLRVGAAVRAISYVILLGGALAHPGLIIDVLILTVAIWIHLRWQKAGQLAFYAVARDGFAAFSVAAMQYQYPGHRRGALRYMTESGPGTVLSLFGLVFMLGTGLSLARESDSLATGIPGLYLEHSHLPFWAVALGSFLLGSTVTLLGQRIERAKRRQVMRRETALPEGRASDPQMVFLRPFGIEERRVPANPGPRRDGFAILVPHRSDFLEDVVTWMLWSRGQVVAIARPHEQLRTVGAAHHEVRAGESWTAAVDKLLARSTGIVLVPGATPGVAWEFDQLRRSREYAGKGLVVNPEPGGDPRPFLDLVGCSANQAASLRERRLKPIAAMLRPVGPAKLLCSSRAEDIDIEVAVEWFLWKELAQPQRRGRLSQMLARALGAEP